MATITKEKTAEIIARLGKNPSDSGSARAQIAILTERIANLTEHCNKNRKDVHSLRGLQMLVSKRKRLLKYYARKDLEGYRILHKELNLRGSIS
ncbi:MAG: 30S ribosomal protein S15 [Fibromonadaceae bacterium]|jgi:small subunit ribosomal protein S15|nr:30S ribosomal protein S15 [Fibromonadaceae bacterium]